MKLGKNKELYECSIQGFITDNFKNFKSDNEMDYINKSVAYILRYGLNELNPRFSLEELIHNFKNQVGIIVAKKQLENDPNDLTNMHSKENDLALKYLFKDPVAFVKAKLEDDDYYNSIKDANCEGLKDYEKKYYVRRLDTNRKYLINLLGNTLDDDRLENDKVENDMPFKDLYTGFENGRRTIYYFKLSLEAKVPEGIDNKLESMKPKSWEKFFKTTSKEYNDFTKIIGTYKVLKGNVDGDTKMLEEATMKYIRHKFPKLKAGELPTQEQIFKLKGAGKDRALFCLKVLETIRDVRQIQGQVSKMNEAVKSLDLGELKLEYIKSNAKYDGPVQKANDVKKSNSRLKNSSMKGSNENKKGKKLQFGESVDKTKIRTKEKGGPKGVKLLPLAQRLKNKAEQRSQMNRWEDLKEERLEEEEKEKALQKELETNSKKVVIEASDNKEFQANLEKDSKEVFVENKIDETEISTNVNDKVIEVADSNE